MNPSDKPWPPHGDEIYRRQVTDRVGADLATNLADIKLMVFDADGVLTPGNLMYGPDGEALKEFHSHDGLGLVMARVAGVKCAVLTGRHSAIVERRASELRFASIKLGRFDKLTALEEILAETGIDHSEALYMGDDLIDVPAMLRVAVAVSVPAAPDEVKDRSDYVTRSSGGAGAVREVTDLVLKASGRFGTTLARLADEASRPTAPQVPSDKADVPPQEMQ